MLLDISQTQDEILVSYYNEEGKTKFKKYELKKEDKFKWIGCSEKDKRRDKNFLNWDGSPVKKKHSNFLDNFRLIEFFEEKIPQSDKDDIFVYNFPKTYFVDIETEVVDEFPDPDQAKYKVTTICIVTPEKGCIVLAIKDLTKESQVKIQSKIDDHFSELGENFNFNFKFFKSEYDMLYTFLKTFLRNFPMVTGWNFINFDWKYIHNRSVNLGIDPSIASPVDEIKGKNNIPLHVGMIDYLDIYKKWDRAVDIKVDFKLDTVGSEVLDIKKVKYEGTLQDLYEKEYEKYVFYNAIDTALVYLIHEKIRTLDIALTIAHMSKISIFKASSPVAITNSLLGREYYKNNRVVSNEYTDNQKTAQFEGAFVKEPIKGMHDSIACFDFASLYPSIMMQLNISPESFLGTVEDDKIKESRNKDVIIAENGAIFDATEESILKKTLKDLYSQRKQYKKKSFELQQKAYELEKN